MWWQQPRTPTRCTGPWQTSAISSPQTGSRHQVLSQSLGNGPCCTLSISKSATCCQSGHLQSCVFAPGGPGMRLTSVCVCVRMQHACGERWMRTGFLWAMHPL